MLVHKRVRAPTGTTPSAGHVYGYCRVSTLIQASDGLSLDVQQRTIAGYAQMHGLTMDQVFVERGVSGSKPLADRPEGEKLLALLQPGDTVITPKLDRMFRSAVDALDVLGRLKERNVSLHMIDLGGDTTGNGISRLVFTILAAVAEAERDRIRERITEVKRDQRRRGRHLGGSVQFGFTLGPNGTLVPEPTQQRAIKRAKVLYQRGFSLRKIRDDLTKRGHQVSHVLVGKLVSGTHAARARVPPGELVNSVERTGQ
jgi:putative DNA-invertase from lambdoid prophage Rac